jgi:hypothetical protein
VADTAIEASSYQPTVGIDFSNRQSSEPSFPVFNSKLVRQWLVKEARAVALFLSLALGESDQTSELTWLLKDPLA